MACESCGDKPKKCNKDFTKAVIEIDNPEQITLMRKVTIPASMGDDTTVPPVVGKYKNVILYYEANSKTYIYSSDGIPTQLVNGVTDYEAAVNLPQINGHTLLGNKTATQLGLQDKLTAGENISIDGNNVISAVDTTYGPATDTEIGLVKPGDGLEVDTNGTMSIILSTIQSDWDQEDNAEFSYIKNKPTIPAAQVQSDWNQSDNNEVDFIKNKPTIPVIDYSESEIDTGGVWIDNNSIYKKTIDIDSLPDTGTKTVAHGISNFSQLVKLEGTFTDNTNSAPLPYSSPAITKNVQVYIDDTNIVIMTGEDRTSYNGFVTLYYTKNS